MVFVFPQTLMHLSILSPTTPLPGVPGGIVGDLIRFDAPLVGLLTVHKINFAASTAE